MLKAYDACGSLIQEVYVDNDPRAPVLTKMASVYHDTKARIARVTLGGAQGHWVQIDNIQAHVGQEADLRAVAAMANLRKVMAAAAVVLLPNAAQAGWEAYPAAGVVVAMRHRAVTRIWRSLYISLRDSAPSR